MGYLGVYLDLVRDSYAVVREECIEVLPVILAALDKGRQESVMESVLSAMLRDKAATVKVKALEVIVPCLCTL